MSHAISLEPTQAKAEYAAVSAIAQDTSTSVEVVKTLYEEEVATLVAQATIKQFVGVIATRRVKQQLRDRVHNQQSGPVHESTRTTP
jgi:Protein of unknown function (DUF3562)